MKKKCIIGPIPLIVIFMQYSKFVAGPVGENPELRPYGT
jgi:hypothetical protein